MAFVWVKQNRRNDDLFTGMGYWTRANAEICILATKGHPKRVDAGVRQVILSHIEEHSKKPDEARERIVRLMGDLPRVELFARQSPEGWDVWGNEVECTAHLRMEKHIFVYKAVIACLTQFFPLLRHNSHLRASKPDGDGNVCLMKEGGNIVYTISAEKVPWVKTSYDSLVNEYVLYPKMSALSEVSVNDGKNTYTFSLSTAQKTKTDDNGSESTTTTTTVKNGKTEIELATFSGFYENLTMVELADTKSDSKNGSPVLTVTYKYSSDGSTDTVSYYKSDSNRYVVCKHHPLFRRRYDIPDALAGLAASAALAVSDIPFNGPISEVRVARIDGQFVINPTFDQLEKADMDLMVGATYENIMMVEGEMSEVSELDLLNAMKAAHEAIKVQCLAQKELAEAVGSTVKREYCHEVNDEELRKAVHEACYAKAYAIAASGNKNKHERMDAFDAIREEFKAQFSEEELAEKAALIDRYYHDVEKEAMRRSILDEGKRLDGRKTDEIRPIWSEINCLPGPHGSAIFTRGETQSLSTVTLGTKLDEKIIDNVLEHGKERFLLHYNFPPFSTGEAKAQRGVGRREVGHGHLAWRALKGQIPADSNT